jgi:RNA polymerase sigma factor (sigma-70 family)
LKTKKVGLGPAFFYALEKFPVRKEVAPWVLFSSIIVVSLCTSLGGFLQKRHKELLELLDKSGASLYKLLTRLTLREDIAEELMQELFIKLSNSRGFRKCISRDAYARKTAINLAFDWRRKFRHKLRLPSKIYEPVSNDSSALSKLIQTEELEEILDAIGQLNRTWRQALVMRYIQQLSYDDIAGQMEKTPHHARALCSKALNRLRDILGTNQKNTAKKEI